MSGSAEVPQQVDDLEAAQPLLCKSSQARIQAYDAVFETPDKDTVEIEDSMTYRLQWLKGWGVFCVLRQTVWDNPALWRIMLRLVMVAMIVGFASFKLIPDPQLLHVEKFDEMNTVLSAFVSLMLSFFLSNAVGRWLNCVDGLYSMINAIKNYSMQLHAFGVESDKIHLALRYCVLSAHCLVHELCCLKIGKDRQAMANQLFWEELQEGETEYAKLDAGEREVLEEVERPSAQLWIWVGAHLASMAVEGDVPPMSSPAYGNLMNLIQSAQEGQRQTRIAVIVQMPLVYLHTLAYLVHVNSLVFAVITGMTYGATIHGIQDTYTKADLTGKGSVNMKTAFSTISVTEHIQMLLIEGIKGLLAPLLIQAFLQIALAIVSPFHDEDAAIPTRKLLQSIETELKDALVMRSKPQKFDMTPFKKPSSPAK